MEFDTETYSRSDDHNSKQFIGSSENTMRQNQNQEDSADIDTLKRITELTEEDVLGLHFISETEAYEFYKKYARCHGFVIRKSLVTRDRKGDINSRIVVCNKAGSRDRKHLTRENRVRDHRPITRLNCKARIKFKLDKTSGKWIVSTFESQHTHELIPDEYIDLMAPHREMSETNRCQIDTLHSHRIKTCDIMSVLVGQHGGHANVGISKKDLYNYIDRKKRANLADGDAYAVLSYLQAKTITDPMIYTRFTICSEGRLQHLFWADGECRADYIIFGDVLAFDATYKKNRYNRPLLIFSGTNHHSQSIIFVCALLGDETVETYEWVLQTFLDANSNMQPQSVVTDGDAAMKHAIKKIFPASTHRLCAWHLQRNACENIKVSKFLEDFTSIMFANIEPKKFERSWNEIMNRYNLSENKWVKKLYSRIKSWANAYLREKFFAGYRTTSRCESINASLKKIIGRQSTIVDLIHGIETAIREIRNNERTEDYISRFTTQALTTPLVKLESHAAKTYTRKMFTEVKKSIMDAGAMNVLEKTANKYIIKYVVDFFCKPEDKFIVIQDIAEEKFS